MARLTLLVPPAGTDPAAAYDLLRQHLLGVLTWQVTPGLVVRTQYDVLPGGPSERAAIAALQQRKIELEEAAEELDGKSPPRPTPPQYLSLQEDVSRFASGLATLPRMVELISAVGRCEVAAVQEARAWLDNAGAVSSRISTQYPFYRDILQPLQLAIQEVRYGLALSIGAADLMARGDALTLESAAARLLAFPHPLNTPLSLKDKSSGLDAPAVQHIAARAASQASSSRAAANGSTEGEAVGHAAGILMKINLLRVAMQESREEWRHGATAEVKKKGAVRLHSIFAAFVTVWEDIKEEEERRAAEEAELFKTKSRTVDVPTEEEEAEVDFQKVYPDQFSAFADLADADDFLMDNNEDGSGNAVNAAMLPKQPEGDDSQKEHSAAAAAAFAAKDYFLSDILQEVVATHAEVFGRAPASAGVGGEKAAFLRSYELGMQLVELSGGCLSAKLDDDSMNGHLYAAAARARELIAQGSSSSLSIANTTTIKNNIDGDDDDVEADIHQSRPEEAVLVQDCLQGLRTRIVSLLEEWPDHPVLMQLDAIVDRILSMSVNSPLKALLTGLELLLARAQVWEETAAKHVSIAAQLKVVAALATRWRRIELVGWRALLKRTVARAEAGANQGWFHLYRIMQARGENGSESSSAKEIGVVVEQFIQGSPLGEYKARLGLLHAFKGQILAVQSEEQSEKEVERNATLVAILGNVHCYYSQFTPQVEAAIAAGLAPSEKDLKDFVKLAKWEDRGYYAMKASTEKAQRHLHKLCRRAANALKEYATSTLAIAAKSMGLDDLSAPESVGNERAAAAAATNKSKSKKQQQHLNGAAVVAALADGKAAAAAFTAATAAIGVGAISSALPDVSGKYTKQLPELTLRFGKIVQRGLTASSPSAAASLFTDELAATVAERAVQLRSDVSKGVKSRKKKALVDYFRALGAAGVSKLRSAVPAQKRGFHAWFSQPVPEMEAVLASSVGSAGDQNAAALTAWTKSDAYYYASMARLQRLLEVRFGSSYIYTDKYHIYFILFFYVQAAKYPHADLTSAEVGAACRTSEHLLYLSQVGRESLGRVADQISRLNGLLTLLEEAAEWETEDLLPPQSSTSHRCKERQESLAALLTLLTETQELQRAAAELEPVAEARQGLVAARSSLSSAANRFEAAAGELSYLVAQTCCLPSGQLFITSKLMVALEKSDSVLVEVASELSQQVQHVEQPGWAAVVSAVQDACSSPSSLVNNAAAVPTTAASEEELLSQLAGEVEGVVQAELLWAQNTLEKDSQQQQLDKNEEEEDEEQQQQQQHLPDSLDSARKRLGLTHLTTLVDHLMSALSCLAALADSKNNNNNNVHAGVRMLTAAVPMLRVLRVAVWQATVQCLAFHRSITKLTYITAALFTGVMEEGFCVPDSGEEGEAQEGEAQMKEGTGLGEGDTTGAKDISDELEDEDQLLGAQKKGEEEKKEEQPEAPPPPEGEEDTAKGVEMEDDFEGALEDVKPDANEDDEDAPEDEGDEERLEQQMGDVGDAGEDVDERLWAGEDDGEDENEGKDKVSL